jgi:FkbM family methyltransferase
MGNIFGFLRKRKSKILKEDAFQAQKYFFDNDTGLVIFDVGAYIGEVTATYKSIFPNATIYCFEPFWDSFQKLKKLCTDSSIAAYQIAMSDKQGTAVLNINMDLSCNSLFPRPDDGFRYYAKDSQNTRQIEVDTTTLDNFCEKTKISTIDILKIDVEGAETKVLKGASGLLSNQAIKLIYTEVMFIAHYRQGCLFHDVAAFLSNYNYSLFNLYNLKRASNGQLRWGNAIFINPQMRSMIETSPRQEVSIKR